MSINDQVNYPIASASFGHGHDIFPCHFGFLFFVCMCSSLIVYDYIPSQGFYVIYLYVPRTFLLIEVSLLEVLNCIALLSNMD